MLQLNMSPHCVAYNLEFSSLYVEIFMNNSWKEQYILFSQISSNTIILTHLSSLLGIWIKKIILLKYIRRICHFFSIGYLYQIYSYDNIIHIHYFQWKLYPRIHLTIPLG